MSRREPTQPQVDRRLRVTVPGRPVSRNVSHEEIERYLRAKGYKPLYSVAADWPRHVQGAWEAPRVLPVGESSYYIPPLAWRTVVPSPRRRTVPMAKVIAKNEGRAPSAVLREIAVLALVAGNGG
ncbi:hypothetical protein [Sorangium sp. So ce1335]|uniref:hypothetical protein n=1 Tax=Sorangium sp. So ce1335 TaxID=3133335 RepID=UPI003F6081E1